MKSFQSPKICLLLCKIVGFGLLFAFWIGSGELTGFSLILFLIALSLLRWRLPKLWFTFAIDGILLWIWGQYLVLAIFLVAEVFYRVWEKDHTHILKQRDMEASRFYELETLQNDLTSALAQVERMTAVAERARISREIHDKAGHEIVAAYISLQTVREMLNDANTDKIKPDVSHKGSSNKNVSLTEALIMYDAALERLGIGADKIREAVHNLSTTTLLGVEGLQDVCKHFPACQVEFKVYGNSSKVPMYVWGVLEACLNESLTNVVRHSTAEHVLVNLDITPHIIRLCIENERDSDLTNAEKNTVTGGMGLRNLRHRAAAIGGSLSIDAGRIFRVICVIPIGERSDEITYC